MSYRAVRIGYRSLTLKYLSIIILKSTSTNYTMYKIKYVKRMQASLNIPWKSTNIPSPLSAGTLDSQMTSNC